MRLDVLGPLRVTGVGGPVVVPRGRVAAALCWLIMNAGDSIRAESLLPILWDQPPATALAKTRAILRDLTTLLGSQTLARTSQGFRIVAEGSEIDVLEFERCYRSGAASVAAGRLEHAESDLRGALALWRGDAYPDLARALPALAEIGRLTELRLSAQEDLNGLAFRGAVTYELVAELRAQVVVNRERVRLRRQLALALYRVDRQVEALAELREARVEHGDADGQIAALESEMLQHAPDLMLAVPQLT